MNILARSSFYLALAAGCSFGAAANAADLILPEPIAYQDDELLLPAVSGVNGKWELSGGLFNPGGIGFRAAGSVSIPLGERFGAQGDVMATWTGSDLYLAGAGHLFTRDPSLYLLGVTGGVVVEPGVATLGAVGLEGELYLDRWSLEGWAGVAAIDYVAILPPDQVGFFAIGDIAFYPTDDLRFTVGGSYILGDTALHLGAEYQLTSFAWPVSLTTDARIHSGGAYAITAGIKGYIGGEPGKSLIDRHRQDDPPNRALDLFSAAGGLLDPDPPTDEEICLYTEEDFGDWIYDDGDCYFDDGEQNPG
ncbi:MAG: hypothetical protein EOP22_05045 [Hyphomicrobiales bacterium]|nr:MAG: hypothetical protein EOP22_05045 [Hyphomicrobiales bacterium]